MAAKNRRILESATGQPAVESPERVPDMQTWAALLRFGRTISDNGLLCQREVVGYFDASVWAGLPEPKSNCLTF